MSPAVTLKELSLLRTRVLVSDGFEPLSEEPLSEEPLSEESLSEESEATVELLVTEVLLRDAASLPVESWMALASSELDGSV